MADEIVVVCKECGKKLKTDKKFLGRKGRCPHCGAAIRIAPGGEGKEGGAEQVVTFGEVETPEGALLRIRKQDDIGIVDFTTSRILDQSNVQQLGEEFDQLLDEHNLTKIVLDFEKVNYMSSAVMGKLITLHKKVANVGGQLRLCHISDSIFEIFEIMRFDKIFNISKTQEEAVSELM